MIETRKLTHHDGDWSGYTLDEMRYQRAVTLARLEVQKEKLKIGTAEMRNGAGQFGSTGIAGKIMGSLNYLDYIILAFKATRMISKALRSLKRH